MPELRYAPHNTCREPPFQPITIINDCRFRRRRNDMRQRRGQSELDSLIIIIIIKSAIVIRNAQLQRIGAQRHLQKKNKYMRVYIMETHFSSICVKSMERSLTRHTYIINENPFYYRSRIRFSAWLGRRITYISKYYLYDNLNHKRPISIIYYYHYHQPACMSGRIERTLLLLNINIRNHEANQRNILWRYIFQIETLWGA